MDSSVWDRCPSTTNAVERRNAECKSKQSVALQHALTNVYKLDKSVCAKHLAALDGCSVSYHDRSENARRSAAKNRQKQRLAVSIPDDPTALQDHLTEPATLINLARGKQELVRVDTLLLMHNNYA